MCCARVLVDVHACCYVLEFGLGLGLGLKGYHYRYSSLFLFLKNNILLSKSHIIVHNVDICYVTWFVCLRPLNLVTVIANLDEHQAHN